MFTRDRRTDGSEETSEDVRFPYARAYGREDAPVRATCWRAYACELHQEVLERFLDPIVEVGPHGRSRTLRTPSVGDPKGPTPRPVDATNAPTTPHFPQSQSLFPVQRKSAVDWIGCEAHRVRLASSAASRLRRAGRPFGFGAGFCFVPRTHARTRNATFRPFVPLRPLRFPPSRFDVHFQPALRFRWFPSHVDLRTSIPSASHHMVPTSASPAPSCPRTCSPSSRGGPPFVLDRSCAEVQAARTREATSNVTRVASSPLPLLSQTQPHRE